MVRQDPATPAANDSTYSMMFRVGKYLIGNQVIASLRTSAHDFGGSLSQTSPDLGA
jgi:hypothetical protein